MTGHGNSCGRDRRTLRIWCRRNFPRLRGQCFGHRPLHLPLKLLSPLLDPTKTASNWNIMKWKIYARRSIISYIVHYTYIDIFYGLFYTIYPLSRESCAIYSRFWLIGPSINRSSHLFERNLEKQIPIKEMIRVFLNYLGQHAELNLIWTLIEFGKRLM